MLDEALELKKTVDMLAPEQAGVEVAPVRETESSAAVVQTDTALQHEAMGDEKKQAVRVEGHVQEVAVPVPEKEPMYAAVEEILEEHLGPLFDGMSAEQKLMFVARGETLGHETVAHISGRVPPYFAILADIKKWLHMIPNLTRDWVEQEAKIKTDAIMCLKT